MPDAAVFDDVKPWPGESAGSGPAPKGHNRPPPEEVVPLEFKEELLRERPEFLQKMEDLIGAADRAKAEDDTTLGLCGDLVKGYRACLAHVDETHKTVKAPYLTAGRLVDAEKNALTERLNAAKMKVERIGNEYVAKRDAERRAEEARREAEARAAAERAAEAERERERAEQEALKAQQNAANEEERRAAEERAKVAAEKAEAAMSDAALAPAAPDKVEPVRSDGGATVSGKQEWKCEVTDYTVAFVAVEDDPRVREAIDKAIARLVRAGKRSIEGCRIWPVAKGVYR